MGFDVGLAMDSDTTVSVVAPSRGRSLSISEPDSAGLLAEFRYLEDITEKIEEGLGKLAGLLIKVEIAKLQLELSNTEAGELKNTLENLIAIGQFLLGLTPNRDMGADSDEIGAGNPSRQGYSSGSGPI